MGATRDQLRGRLFGECTEQSDPNLGVHIGPKQLHRDMLPHALTLWREAEPAALSAKREGAWTAKAAKAGTQAVCSGPLVKEPGIQKQHLRIQSRARPLDGRLAPR